GSADCGDTISQATPRDSQLISPCVSCWITLASRSSRTGSDGLAMRQRTDMAGIPAPAPAMHGTAARAVLIAGPTASGKSALALRRARELGGVVVNADAMQVYDVLQVLTARPDTGAMSGVPHLLYGKTPPQLRCSTGD